MKRIRAGKKGSIAKRVAQLKRLVSEGGSRSKIRYLVTALLEIHKATKEVNHQILQLSDNNQVDVAWLEDVDFTVDNCMAEVYDYLDARVDDPSSVPSITESWVQNHSPQADLLPGDDERFFDAPPDTMPVSGSQAYEPDVAVTVADVHSIEDIGTKSGFGIAEKSIENSVYETLGATGGLGTSTMGGFGFGAAGWR